MTYRDQAPVIRVPLDKLENISKHYCADKLSFKDREPNLSIPRTFTFDGQLYFCTGNWHAGLDSESICWRLVEPENWTGRTYEVMHDELAIACGERERGDATGTAVRYHNKEYIVGGLVRFTATIPSIECALTVQQVQAGKLPYWHSTTLTKKLTNFRQHGHLVMADDTDGNNGIVTGRVLLHLQHGQIFLSYERSPETYRYATPFPDIEEMEAFARNAKCSHAASAMPDLFSAIESEDEDEEEESLYATEDDEESDETGDSEIQVAPTPKQQRTTAPALGWSQLALF